MTHHNTCIAFSSKDRVELSKRSIKPLLKGDFDLMWCDGSGTQQGKAFFEEHKKQIPENFMFAGVRGGSGAAIVFALTKMLYYGLGSGNRYEYVGLVENDVLLPKNWFAKTMELFERGDDAGIRVGAVSARCYEDRILVQRDGYAVMHNLGAGMVIFSRSAAELVLRTYRTQWSTENRITFAQFVNDDIGAYWAFGGSEHWLCADWRWDAVLASHGYASLALTPSHVEMIGQNPPLEKQGLKIAHKPVDSLRSDDRFKTYCYRMAAIGTGLLELHTSPLCQLDHMGGQMIFAHQVDLIGGRYDGDWRLKDSIGFGPFGWKAGNELDCSVTVPVLGPCAMFLSGGEYGGQVEVIDKHSGFHAKPQLPPEGPQGVVVPVAIPSNVSYRDVYIKPLASGVVFYGLRCRDPQPTQRDFKFTFETLPPL